MRVVTVLLFIQLLMLVPIGLGTADRKRWQDPFSSEKVSCHAS